MLYQIIPYIQLSFDEWDNMVSVHSKEYQRLLTNLRKARTATGLTQVQVAKLLGRPQSYVSRCESGETRVDLVDLKKFARLYKKSILYF
jgi:ribosome-binding protein aMBF1 (putative translation factor)